MIDKLSPEYRSYIIGFLQGDGSNSVSSRNRGKITIELSIRDNDIIDKLIEKFSPYINVRKFNRTRDTNFKKKYTSVGLYIYDLKTRLEFSKYIPTGCKSRTVETPKDISVSDYIRGLSDADGSLGITSENRCFWSLCTSSESVKSLVLGTIKQITGLKKNINRNKRDDVYNISIFDEDAQVFSSFLYKNASICLDRKLKSYMKVMQWKRPPERKKRHRRTFSKEEDLVILNNSISIEEKKTILNRTEKSIRMRKWRLTK